MWYTIVDVWQESPIGWLLLLLFGLLALLVLGLVAFGVDYALGHTKIISVTVVEKTYSPASTSTGVGTGVTSNGKVGTGMVVTSTPEKFVLIVRDDAGEVFSKSVEARVYADSERGDTIRIKVRIGLSGARYT